MIDSNLNIKLNVKVNASGDGEINDHVDEIESLGNASKDAAEPARVSAADLDRLAAEQSLIAWFWLQ